MKLLMQVVLILLIGASGTYFMLAWLGSSKSDDQEVLSLDQQALRLADSRGCLACHSIDGSKGIGPSWLGGWGTQRAFLDGSTALVDEEYLRESMAMPAEKIVEGFESIMLPSAFTPAETDLIVALIKNLNTKNP